MDGQCALEAHIPFPMHVQKLGTGSEILHLVFYFTICSVALFDVMHLFDSLFQANDNTSSVRKTPQVSFYQEPLDFPR